MIIACRTLIIWAMLAMRTRSAWRGGEVGVGAGQRRVPRAPLVDDEGDPLLRVVLVHDGRMLTDQTLHLQRGLEDLGVLGLAEPDGRELLLPIYDRVRVQREPVHVPAPLAILVRLHDGLGPLGEARLAAARADGDLEHPLPVRLRRVEV